MEISAGNLPEPLADRDTLRAHVAKLYGQGMRRPQIAKAMYRYLSVNSERPIEQRIRAARSKLKRWEREPAFRDLVWELAVVELDMDSPAILRGIARSAKRGRVDAAKLSLEITGRHVTKGDQTAPNITIAFAGIPRPGPIQIADAEVVDEPSEDN
jgi:hypothetical protein